MKPYLKLIAVINLIILFSSCANYKEITIGEVKSFHFKGFNDNKLAFNLIIPIENPNHQNIIISKINLKAFTKKSSLGMVETTEKLIITKNTKQDYEIPITIKITNLFAGFSLLKEPSDIISQLKFEGYIQVRKGLFCKKIIIDQAISEEYLKF